MLPLNDTDFRWLRYFCGLALPVVLALAGLLSLVAVHSYTIWFGLTSSRRGFSIVPVDGEQAVLMGLAYLGLALALFANCYAQYHEKMAYHYQWLLVPGVMLAGGGMLGCSLIFIFGEF